jgi:hypothetical protein
MAASTYWSRVSEMMDVCGPPSWPSLLATTAELRAAKALVDASRSPGKEREGVDALALRRAEYLVRASYHPDTNEIIPLPFRMAAHVPANSVLLVGMLLPRTVFFTGLWQGLNQSFNAAQFYANRNASNHVSDTTVAVSFSAAVVSSVAVGAGLRHLLLRAEARAQAAGRPSTLVRNLALAVPFLGAAAGKPLQIGLMRRDEIEQGVEVFDGYGRSHGRSVAAGRAAVGMTIATRVIYLAPMLWMPFVQTALERAVPILRTNRVLGIASYTIHAALNSAFATPLCIALFDQRASLPVASLEERFKGEAGGDGKALERVFFNKGL